MKYYYQIAIQSVEEIKINNKEILFLDDAFTIIDSYKATKNNDEYFFDYLISDNLNTIKQLKAIIDNKKALVNSSLQTSVENLFAFSNAVNTNLSINEQINTILESIEE